MNIPHPEEGSRGPFSSSPLRVLEFLSSPSGSNNSVNGSNLSSCFSSLGLDIWKDYAALVFQVEDS